MGLEEAERMLSEWATVTRERERACDPLSQQGSPSTVCTHITGIGRSTIGRIAPARTIPSVPALCQSRPK
jgi:hypothetical protein